MDALQDAAVSTLIRCQDPRIFVRELLHAEPDPWQDDALLAYWQNQRSAIVGSKGDGKTTVLAWVKWHFLSLHPHANVAATSISGDNLRDGLWKESALWLQRSPFLQANFEWQRERIVSRSHPAT